MSTTPANDGGPAFPHTELVKGNSVCFADPGMSLRDYFAAKALQGFCANPAIFAHNGQTGWGLVNCTEEQLANHCLFIADAMLAARNQTTK